MARKLFVGNLPYSVTMDELKQTFCACGEVISANIIIDRETGQSKGFGFVEMASDEQAIHAIEQLNGSMINERRIIVDEAKSQQRPIRRDRDDRSLDIRDNKDWDNRGNRGNRDWNNDRNKQRRWQRYS